MYRPAILQQEPEHVPIGISQCVARVRDQNDANKIGPRRDILREKIFPV